MKLFASLNAI